MKIEAVPVAKKKPKITGIRLPTPELNGNASGFPGRSEGLICRGPTACMAGTHWRFAV